MYLLCTFPATLSSYNWSDASFFIVPVDQVFCFLSCSFCLSPRQKLWLMFSDQRAKDVDTGFCFLRIHQVCGLFHCYHVSQKVCGRLVVRKRCDPSLTCSWLQISRAQSLQGVSSYMSESLKVFKVFDLQVYLSYFKRNLALLYTDSKPFSGAVYSF